MIRSTPRALWRWWWMTCVACCWPMLPIAARAADVDQPRADEAVGKEMLLAPHAEREEYTAEYSAIAKTGCCTCPNNYCRKPLPFAPCLAGCCPNCYCPKPLPYSPPASPVCCNNYYPKPLICPPKLCEPWYTCGMLVRSCSRPVWLSGGQSSPPAPLEEAAH